jgi:hypothetical protein
LLTTTLSSLPSVVKFDVKKFEWRITFDLWKIQVKDILIQLGLYKALNQMLGMSPSLWDVHGCGPAHESADPIHKLSELDLLRVNLVRFKDNKVEKWTIEARVSLHENKAQHYKELQRIYIIRFNKF